MEPVVLVTYATRSGSTEEVARTVAEVLREDGLVTEVQHVREAHDLEQYCAVVLAAPLYMSRLHKDARRFLSAHRGALMKVPVALFVLGPIQAVEKDWTGALQQLDMELKKFPWLSPAVQHVVGGKFDPAKMGFPFNLIPALRKLPASDVRDWPAIRGFASDLATMFQGVKKSAPVRAACSTQFIQKI
jgi:menaquinone-dependent protoporphyrinogen oxidase